jgi:biotin transport system substrate-specific component
MSSLVITPSTPRLVLADALPGSKLRDACLVLGGAALTGLAAQVAITTPLTPVPFTLQTFAVLLVGASFGPVRGLLSMLLYVMAGIAGVPWFAEHSSGWGGPTFGYIVGFLVASVVAGALARRGADRSILGTVATMVLGNVAIYGIGIGWLAVSLHIDLAAASRLGIWPFLAGDAVKILVAALLLPGAWQLARRLRG